MRSGATFPGESAEYRRARDDLNEAEIELRRTVERVAAIRRGLPPGGPLPEDYEFDPVGDDGAGPVRMSALFAPGRDSLIVYSLMFGPRDERPCPSCTSIIDSLDGAAPHVSERANLVVVAKSPPERIAALASARGWRRVRLLSSAENSYNRDYLAEDPDGVQQRPMLNVFVRDGGAIRHFWGSEMLYGPWDDGQEPRHVDQVWPIWNLLDLTPQGRCGDWGPALEYGQ